MGGLYLRGGRPVHPLVSIGRLLLVGFAILGVVLLSGVAVVVIRTAWGIVTRWMGV